MMKHGFIASGAIGGAAALLTMAAAPASAQTTTLTFNAGETACTAVDNGPANQVCTTGGQLIGGNYGSTALLAVSYNASEPNNQTPRTSLQFATGGRYTSDGEAYSFPAGAADELSRIVFTPAPGYEVSFGGFSYDKLTATSESDFIFEVRNPLGNVIFSRMPAFAVPRTITVDTAYYAGPLTFLFGNGGRGLVAVDDVSATVRLLAVTPGAVPEPASWAMMIAGFGLLGGALRRRRPTPAFA